MSRPRSQTRPDATADLLDPSTVEGLFSAAAEANEATAGRRGGVVELPARGRLVVGGDLHDHGPNLERLLRLAALHASPDHHLVLQDLSHAHFRVNDRDLSIRALARVAALKERYPDQLHLIQSNHELAQYIGEPIFKSGVDLLGAFHQGLRYIYEDEASSVTEALHAFLGSLPLAVRTANGIFCAHSLPDPGELDRFDPDIIARAPSAADLAPGGSAHRMVWGRRLTEDLIDALAKAWEARVFVLGHQNAPAGYAIDGSERALILASDHERGMALNARLAEEATMGRLLSWLVPLGDVAV